VVQTGDMACTLQSVTTIWSAPSGILSCLRPNTAIKLETAQTGQQPAPSAAVAKPSTVQTLSDKKYLNFFVRCYEHGTLHHIVSLGGGGGRGTNRSGCCDCCTMYWHPTNALTGQLVMSHAHPTEQRWQRQGMGRGNITTFPKHWPLET
jgi:hypothetical protein